MNLLAPITQNKDMVSKEYVDKLIADLDLSGYAKTSDLGSLASKNSLAFSELTAKPTTLAGYGITDIDISGYIRAGGALTFKGDMMSLTEDSQSYCWRIASIIDGAQLQVGWKDGSSNNGKFYFTGMYGNDLELFNVRAKYSYFDGETVVFRNTVGNQFNAHATFKDGITTDGENAILGVIPDGGTYPRFRLFPHLSGFYFQAASYDGKSDKGNLQFSGMYGANAEEVHFKSDYTEFHGSVVVDAYATFKEGVTISAGKAITFLDSAGASHTLTYDSSKKAFKIDGDFYATGENSAGGIGSELVDIEDLASRVTALETSGGMSNVNIKVTTLSLYNQQSITSTAMSSIAGLTVAIAENMVKGAYNKVVDNGGTYPKIWNYTATKSSTTTMTICFSYGDGINTKESCRLDYSSSTGKWTIEIDEL